MDNVQFHFGQALKGPKTGMAAKAKSELEKLVVTQVKGFDPFRARRRHHRLRGLARRRSRSRRSALYRIAKKHGGMKAGAANGERGYQLTFGIAYIRDLTFEHWAIAESFETSVPWSKRAWGSTSGCKRAASASTRRARSAGQAVLHRPHHAGLPDRRVHVFLPGLLRQGRRRPGRRRTRRWSTPRARRSSPLGARSLIITASARSVRTSWPTIYSDAALALTSKVKSAIDPENLFGAGNHGVNGPITLERHS
jgi:alkyldihydroxyacetonephosphate synthase